MATTKGSKELGPGKEAELRAKARKAKGTSSKGLDARPAMRVASEIAKTPARSGLHAGRAALQGAGAAALAATSGIERAIGRKSKSEDTKARAKQAGKEAMRSAKAVFTGDKKDILTERYAKGGKIDGIARKGKTRGKMR